MNFYGGSFPGTGGTCALSITSNCTLVFSYTPSSATSISESLTLQYDNTSTTASVAVTIDGTGQTITPTKLFLSGPDSVIASECVSFSVKSRDSLENVAPVSSDTLVSFTINNGGGSFYSDSLCTSSISSTTILSGTSSEGVYFKNSTAGESLTIISNTASLIADSRPLAIGNTPTSLLVSSPLEIENGTCTMIEVSSIDTNGIKVGSNSLINVGLSNNKNLLFYSGQFCTSTVTSINFAAYESTNYIYVKDLTNESLTLSAADNTTSLTTANAAVTVTSTLSWYDNDFAKRLRITLNNLDQAQGFSDQAVLVKLSSDDITYSDFNSDGFDLRFVSDDHSTLLCHEVEVWDTSGISYIWVKVPTVLASVETNIYMYFKNTIAGDIQDSNSVWSSYFGVWHLNEDPTSGGPQFQDSTISANHGTEEGGVSAVAGAVGNGATFDGSDDAFDVGYDLAQIIGKSSTLSFWAKTSQVGDNTSWRAPGVTGIEGAGNSNDIFFGYIDASGNLGVNAGDGASAKSNFVINDNAWRFVTISRDETSGDVKFYIDGVANGSGTSESGFKSLSFTKFGVIDDTGGTPEYFAGSLDEIRLYNSVKSDDQIKADYKFKKNTHVTLSSVESK